MNFSEQNAKISKALVQAWASVDTPKHNTKVQVKTKQGGSYTFEYTDLTGIFDALKQVYKEHGIMVMQNAYTTENGHVAVETTLLHESGEFVKSEPLSFPADNNIQGFGGQATYLKRYSLSAMTGISTEKDDDGNYTSGNQASFEKKEITPKQVGAIKSKVGKFAQMRGKSQDDVYAAIELKNIDDIENLSSSQASAMIKKLDGWIKKVEQQGESA